MNIRLNIQLVKLDKIRPNQWNPNRQTDFIFEKELESIRKNGFLVPIIVRESSDGLLEIIDGEHRWRAATQLGMTEVPVNNLGTVEDVDATTLTVLLNEIRGRADSSLMADLMKGLEDTIGRQELELIMPFDRNEMDNLLNSANLDLGSMSGSEVSGASSPADDAFKTVSFRLPEGVADQLEAQVFRFKMALHPGDDIKDMSPVMAIEAICQTLAQIPDDQLI